MDNYRRNLMRLRGFSDGAGSRPIGHADSEDYIKGYTDGQQCKREYAKQSAAELGVTIREIVPLDTNPLKR